MLSFKESLKILKETKALIEGHFILSSGLHSDKYVQCAKLLSKPDKSKEFCISLSEKIKEYYNNGYMIVIFTNQTKKWKHQQIKNVISLLEIPVFIVIATAKVTHKPNSVLFNVLIAPNNIDKDNSFFVGDALGRKSDHSDCDKRFAENIGVKVYSPEEMFLDISNITIPDIPIKEVPEIIIMVTN